jgi:hypothetical protein
LALVAQLEAQAHHILLETQDLLLNSAILFLLVVEVVELFRITASD